MTPIFAPDWPAIDAALARLDLQARGAGQGAEAVAAVRGDVAAAAAGRAPPRPDDAALIVQIRAITAAARFAARIADARPWDDAAGEHANALAQAAWLLHPWDGSTPDPEAPRTPRLHFNAAINAEFRRRRAPDESLAA
jgi:hypothetical protein